MIAYSVVILPVTREKNRLTIEFWNFGKVQSECTNCVSDTFFYEVPACPMSIPPKRLRHDRETLRA
jgi:hypothetical protein